MKYIVQIEIDPEIGTELEEEPQKLQEFLAEWGKVKPMGMYFSLTRRALTIILDAPNEDAFFEPLHKTWVFTGSYPEVWPVADADEFPAIMQRLGMV